MKKNLAEYELKLPLWKRPHYLKERVEKLGFVKEKTLKPWDKFRFKVDSFGDPSNEYIHVDYHAG